MSEQDPAAVLGHYRINTEPVLYALGAFDKHVTVLSQQTRALNLAWSLVETGAAPTRDDSDTVRIAIIGAGFAGLTLAAALRRKEARAEIVMFEERDTLLPLQQGSDTRWLHPHVYDWPDEGSEASAAMLPVLNWTAARASDVVVQVLAEWRGTVAEPESDAFSLRLYCNTRHLQITPCKDDPRHARLEWVGERRDPIDGALPDGTSAKDTSEPFDIVILAVGFGVETGDPSYWRNETFGQPSLNRPRATYLVSGQGDGAMIDLFRVRISQFRQDRILEELFGGRPGLLAKLKALRAPPGKGEGGFFERLEALSGDTDTGRELLSTLEALSRRLRRDTDAVLHLKVRSLAELLEPKTSRMSFQNSLLTYLLYRCGGFAPSREDEAILIERFAIPDEHIIRRHGTKRLEQLKRLLSDELYSAIDAKKKADPDYLLQFAKSRWPGGYFGYPGRTSEVGTIPDPSRQWWRKEYLPGATGLVASVLCGAVAAAIDRMQPDAVHFRATLHRALVIGREQLLQQCCDYVGINLVEATATAGRTFLASNGTIGLAYGSRQIVRTQRDTTHDRIEQDMVELNLLGSARKMLDDVGFVLALPIVQPTAEYFPPSPVVGVLYIDSRSPGFWLNDDQVDELRLLVERTVRVLESSADGSFGRIRDLPMRDRTSASPPPFISPEGVEALDCLAAPLPPSTIGAFVLNFDHSDLASSAATTVAADGTVPDASASDA